MQCIPLFLSYSHLLWIYIIHLMKRQGGASMDHLRNTFSGYLGTPKDADLLRIEALVNVLEEDLRNGNLRRAALIAREIGVPLLIS